MKKYIISVLAIALAFVACEKEDIPVYDASRPSLNFVKSYFTPALTDPTMDTLKLVAVFYAGQEQADFKLPIYLSGPATDHDRKYTMRVSAEKSYGDLVYTSHSRQNRFSMQGNTPIRPSSMQTSPNCARTRLREHWSSSSSRETILPSDWKNTRASDWKYRARDSPASPFSGTRTT